MSFPASLLECPWICIYVIAIKKKGHEFDREPGGLHGRGWKGWKKEGNREDNIIIILKQLNIIQTIVNTSSRLCS